MKEKTNRKTGPKPSGPLARLATKLGSYERLSQSSGISVRSLQRYNAKEAAPSKAVRLLLASIAKANGLRAPFSEGASR